MIIIIMMMIFNKITMIITKVTIRTIMQKLMTKILPKTRALENAKPPPRGTPLSQYL